MKNYDYYEAVKNDVLDYLKCEVGFNIDEILADRDDFEENLYDDLWIHDSVTGNGSGSYTFNRNKAKENVIDNMDLVAEMADDFCIELSELGKHFKEEDWEWFDVSIRCYLLGQAINEVLDDLENDID